LWRKWVFIAVFVPTKCRTRKSEVRAMD